MAGVDDLLAELERIPKEITTKIDIGEAMKKELDKLKNEIRRYM